MGLIIYIIGVIVMVYAIMDVSKRNISTACKFGVSIILLLTSWVGFLFYLFYGKDHIEEWCK